ncbi:hypothetical protein [Bacillus cereus]
MNKKSKVTSKDNLQVKACDIMDGGIKKRPHDIREGHLTMAVIRFLESELEQDIRIGIPTPPRIAREITAAESIWHTSDNKRKVKFYMVYSTYHDSDQINVETMNEEKLKKLFYIGQRYYKASDVYVFYLPGNYVGKPGNLAYSYERTFDGIRTYIIIMSNGARERVESTGERNGNSYILAHELGHVMYYTNYYGWKEDPKPNDDTLTPEGKPDIGHHDDDTEEEKRNLMAPKLPPPGVTPILTDEQVIRALQSRFFLPWNPPPEN